MDLNSAKPSEFSKNSRPISMAEKVENSEYTNSERRGQKNGYSSLFINFIVQELKK